MSFKRASFHIASGPHSLFERVEQKMSGHRLLQLPSRQLQRRWAERGLPVGDLRSFHSEDWELMAAQVRVDRGKFICSTWRRPCGGEWLWIDIGLGDLIERARFKQGKGVGDVVEEGELYDWVASVNQELVDSEPYV